MSRVQGRKPLTRLRTRETGSPCARQRATATTERLRLRPDGPGARTSCQERRGRSRAGRRASPTGQGSTPGLLRPTVPPASASASAGKRGCLCRTPPLGRAGPVLPVPSGWCPHGCGCGPLDPPTAFLLSRRRAGLFRIPLRGAVGRRRGQYPMAEERSLGRDGQIRGLRHQIGLCAPQHCQVWYMKAAWLNLI